MTRASSTNFAPSLRLPRPQPHEVRNDNACNHFRDRHHRLAPGQRGRVLPLALEWKPEEPMSIVIDLFVLFGLIAPAVRR
jgi:hypothetical protein